jgi:hypothetical protein
VCCGLIYRLEQCADMMCPQHSGCSNRVGSSIKTTRTVHLQGALRAFRLSSCHDYRDEWCTICCEIRLRTGQQFSMNMDKISDGVYMMFAVIQVEYCPLSMRTWFAGSGGACESLIVGPKALRSAPWLHSLHIGEKDRSSRR